MKYLRPVTENLVKDINNIPLLHVINGPRQVGKSTAAQQIAELLQCKLHYATADSPAPFDPSWIEAQWGIALKYAKEENTLLVLDEIQKISGWSESVKKLWDENVNKKLNLKIIILGSASILIQQGLSESLAGRFLLHRFTHWSFKECNEAFGWDLSKWLTFGGYPGSSELISDANLWRRYVNDSLIETVISRDVLQLQTVQKPALLKNLFGLATSFPSQILSYNKMLGQLQDAGNTTTLAHYLKLLESAYLISGIELFSKGTIKRKGSSPKLILWNNALITAPNSFDLARIESEPAIWGRLVENAVGAYFLNNLQGSNWRVHYWNNGKDEVDFVLSNPKSICAFEVKSGRVGKVSGLNNFKQKFSKARLFIIGTGGIALEDFFTKPVTTWLE